MTTRNSILLILKQSPGIEFNALLAKISSNYGNINSARAALSRAVKDMQAIGVVQKHGKKIFPTDKGLALLGNEMKTKLILRLNEMLKEGNAAENIDSIVQLLSTLIERAKQDNDLLKAARGSALFYISDLQKIKGELDAKAKHLTYLNEVITQQMEMLKQLNFNDAVALQWNEESKKIFRKLVEKAPGNEIVVECANPDFFEKAKQSFSGIKSLENSLFLSKEQALQLPAIAEQSIYIASNPVNIYSGSMRMQLNHPKIYLMGTVQELEELKK